jgi:hypothetical protein
MITNQTKLSKIRDDKKQLSTKTNLNKIIFLRRREEEEERKKSFNAVIYNLYFFFL